MTVYRVTVSRGLLPEDISITDVLRTTVEDRVIISSTSLLGLYPLPVKPPQSVSSALSRCSRQKPLGKNDH